MDEIAWAEGHGWKGMVGRALMKGHGRQGVDEIAWAEGLGWKGMDGRASMKRRA